jgi:hypothetical protein
MTWIKSALVKFKQRKIPVLLLGMMEVWPWKMKNVYKAPVTITSQLTAFPCFAFNYR